MAKNREKPGKLGIHYRSGIIWIDDVSANTYFELIKLIGARGTFQFSCGKKLHTIILNGIMHVEFEEN